MYILIDFYGENTPSKEKCQKVIEMMENAEDSKRTARFVCAICYIDKNGKYHSFEGTCEGIISKEIRGNNGFDYDMIFLYGDKTFAEISEEEKDKVSHRRNAINKLVDYLKK